MNTMMMLDLLQEQHVVQDGKEDADVVGVLRRFMDSHNMFSSDVVLQEWDVVLRCFKWWMLCYNHDDSDDARCVARVECRSCSQG